MIVFSTKCLVVVSWWWHDKSASPKKTFDHFFFDFYVFNITFLPSITRYSQLSFARSQTVYHSQSSDIKLPFRTMRTFFLILTTSLILLLSHVTADEGDWYNNWDTSVETRTNVGTFASDPRTSFRGSGTIEINYGTMTMIGNPRLYVDNTSFGWKNVEMTGYATWISDGTGGDLTSVAGFVMGARSKHEGFVFERTWKHYRTIWL